jgi:UDP-glucose:(heptosyl)LPS alpha-1,3-glucosyltransferase
VAFAVRIAFLLFRYFPHGGLQRDFRAMAEACERRGHAITVLTMSWEGPVPPAFAIDVVSPRGWTNHRRCLRFARSVQGRLHPNRYDAVVGFNKMPGLDFYFAADPCYLARARKRSWIHRLRALPRFRRAEGAVFSPSIPHLGARSERTGRNI